jgi:hypothetical protein
VTLGWGAIAPAAPTPALSSSLGAAPAATGSGGWGAITPAAAVPAPPSGGGGSGWLGSITDPLGIVSSVKGVVSGLAHTVGGATIDLGQGVGGAIGALGDLATGNVGAAVGQANQGQASFQSLGKRVGDFGVGAITGVESLANTALLPTGLAGLSKRDVFQPFNRWLGQANIISPEMQSQLDNQGKGLAPTNWWDQAKTQGIGAATVNTVLQAAMVAAPVAGAMGAVSGSADSLASAAESAGAAVDATAYAAKADRFAAMQQTLEQFARTPFKTLGRQTAELLGQMRATQFPADVTVPVDEAAAAGAEHSPFSPTTTATPEYAAAAQGATVPQDLLVATRDAMDPAQAATEAMAQSAETMAMALDQLSQLSAPADTTRLYRRGANGNDWSTNPDTVSVGKTATPERLQHVDVPNDRLAQLPSKPHGDNFAQYDLSAAQDLQAKAVEHVPPETVPAPKVGATTEPTKYDVGKPSNYNVHQGRIVTTEEKSVLQDQLRSETAAARAAVHPNLYVVDQLGARLAMPAPQWAVDVANWLPPSVDRLLGKLGADYVDQVRFRNLYRNMSQAMETAQNVARSSDAMRSAESAARDILSGKIDRTTASAIIGQEIHARLNGEALLGEWAKAYATVADNGERLLATPDAAQRAALENAARGGYAGVTDAMWKSLSPTDAAALQEHLNEAVLAFRSEAAKTMQTLLATRYGAKGLEASLLDPSEVPMTTEQVRLFRRSERDLRFAAKARERIPTEQQRVFADAERASATGAKMHTIVDTLRTKLGLTLQTVNDLYRGVPKGLEDGGAGVVQLGLETLARAGGAILDVGTGEALRPTEGLQVQVAAQFDIPLEQWATDGATAIHDAIFNPKAPGGRTYDPQRLWGGPDAKLTLNIANGVDGTQHVVGNIAMHTINGVAMQPWQAYVLGGAAGTAGAFDFATGSMLPLTLDPNEQILMQHYEGMVLDTKSGLSRWANQRAAAIADPALNITVDQLNKEMVANLWLDHIMASRNPTWSKGDIFNTELSVGKGEPSLSYLAQTIMQNLSTHDHVDNAMNAADAEGVSNMLKWYYDSHDAIEAGYRGKTMPLTGRDAAETFYDVLALSSVMASPTQNLGRALAGFANLDDFLKARQGALTDTKAVIDEALGGKLPNDVVYVQNLGQEGERIVGKGLGGTPVSRRWMESPAAQELSNQTSMTTGPKYRIIDALLGRFNLESATAEDISGQPEWWTGNASELSDRNLSSDAIMHHAALLGVTGPALDAYKQWAVDHARISAAEQVRSDAGRSYINPITAAEDTQRIRGEADAAAQGGAILGGRQVSAAEYQQLAGDGRAFVEQRLADSSPHVLDTPEARSAAFKAATAGEWSGATVDAHTGQAIPADYAGDTYAVTARLKGQGEVVAPVNASEAVFNRAYSRALKTYAPQLNGADGQLGIFWNADTNRIEFDPVYHTQNVHDTEAVGAYAHANGGAYNFATGNAFWIPHVQNDEHWTSQAQAHRDVMASVSQGRTLAKVGDMRNAYENALTEYHGSGALAKLRSFRDNLAHPETSLAVTLDSIMAQVFGFDKTHWGVKGEYAKYADQIREVATQWSQIAGRPVMPHEIQALLWVYAKRFIGEQDWGRLQAHVSNAHDSIDTLEQAVNAGKRIEVHNFNPLGDWWNEETQFSKDQLAVRTERAPLRTYRTAGTLTPEEEARLNYLENVPTRQASDVQVMGPDGVISSQQRNETGYDAKVLKAKDAQYLEYVQQVVVPMRKALAAGDFNGARSILDEYVAARRKAVLGSTEGAAFGAKMVSDPKGVGAQSIARLQYAEHVPAPNNAGIGTHELMSKFGDTVRGVTLENPNKLGRILMRLYSTADVTTLLHEDLHAFRLHAPGDEVAQLSREYPHIQDATLTPARVADEERFVSDFMGYLRSGRGPASVSHLFNAVVDTLEQHYGPALDTQKGWAIPNSMVDYWDSIFNKDIQRPAQVDDPLAMQYAPQNRGVNPAQLRGESTAAYAQRVRQYGEARGEATVQQQRINDAEARARTADTFANKMQGLIMEPTKSEIVAQKLEDRAVRTLTKLSTDLQGPEGNQIPRGWRPFMGAIDAIRQEATKDPSLAPLLDEIPANFAAALRFAAERGFEPTYMPEMTWDMAQKYMYGHLRLDTKSTEAGLRKQNMGVLSGRLTGKQSVVDRSLESLGAGTVMAMKELLQSRIAQFTEENYAREWAPGTPLPIGWKPWEPTRDAIITGRRVEDNAIVSVNSNKIIPDAVYSSLKAFQRPALELPFRFLWKGPPTAVWKHLLLTYSPTWYVRHFVGAVSLATIEGARWSDWRTAWKQWKTDTLPAEVRGRSVYTAVDDTSGSTAGTLISRNKVADFPNLVRSEGIKVAVREFNNKLRSVVKTTDSLGRAAAYAHTIRTGGSVELAASRAYEALGDFGRLGPIERSMVSEVIPFYAFQKAMYRILLHLPNSHPAATAILMQVGAMHQAYLKQQLNGSLPDAYLASDFIGGNGTPGNMGHLTQLDKLNPLLDSWKITTPQGIAASTNPFLRILAQYALNSPAYGAGAGMSPTGGLVPQLNIGQSIIGTFTGAVPGLGNPTALNLTSGLSDTQYQQLIKRITKTQTAQATVAAGGYVTTDAVKPKSNAPVAQSGWGSLGKAPKARAATGRSARLSSRIIKSSRIPGLKPIRLKRVSFTPRKSRSRKGL